jgi:hypothetical protein
MFSDPLFIYSYFPSSISADRLHCIRRQSAIVRCVASLHRHVCDRLLAFAVAEFSGSARDMLYNRQMYALLHAIHRWFCFRHLIVF